MADEMDNPFFILVAQLEFGALVGLGVIENPSTKEKKREPVQARMCIDQLEMLAKRTKGNLGADEEKVLEESLYRLRMLFVQTELKAPDAG